MLLKKALQAEIVSCAMPIVVATSPLRTALLPCALAAAYPRRISNCLANVTRSQGSILVGWVLGFGVSSSTGIGPFGVLAADAMNVSLSESSAPSVLQISNRVS